MHSPHQVNKNVVKRYFVYWKSVAKQVHDCIAIELHQPYKCFNQHGESFISFDVYDLH